MNGNVGIGTTSPGGYKLNVARGSYATNLTLNTGLGSTIGTPPLNDDLNQSVAIGFYRDGSLTEGKPDGASSYGSVITTNYIRNTRGQIYITELSESNAKTFKLRYLRAYSSRQIN